MLFKSKNCLAFFKLIDLHKNSTLIHYNHCLFLNILYIMMTDHSKCAECICCEYSCIDIFLKFLNCMHEKLKSKLKLVIKEHVKHIIIVVKLNAKLTKLLNQIRHNKLLFIFKIHCVTTELNNDNNETKNLNSSLMSQLINFISSFFWNLILFLSQNVKVFSHSS